MKLTKKFSTTPKALVLVIEEEQELILASYSFEESEQKFASLFNSVVHSRYTSDQIERIQAITKFRNMTVQDACRFACQTMRDQYGKLVNVKPLSKNVLC